MKGANIAMMRKGDRIQKPIKEVLLIPSILCNENSQRITEKFLNVIEGKDGKWLEIATTILSVYESYRIKFRGVELIERVISTSCDIKSATEAEKIYYVFDELKRVGLIDA